MAFEDRYEIRMDPQFGPLEMVDLQRVIDACETEWSNQTLCKVNDSLVRLGVVKGEFHWHEHEHEDEFFLVWKGRLLLDLEDRTLELGPGQGCTVPRGVRHRTRAPEATVMLMIASDTVTPTGDD